MAQDGAAEGIDRAGVQAAFDRLVATVAAATTAAQAFPHAGLPTPYATSTTSGAEAYVRNLVGLNLGIELLGADPDAPAFSFVPDPLTPPGQDPPQTAGNSNPDNLYLLARIRPGARYEIVGTRGSSADLVLQVLDVTPGAGSLGDVTAELDLDQVAVDDDGRYRITVGPEPARGNHLPTVASSSLVVVRETFADWATAVPDPLTIARIDPAGPAQGTPAGGHLADALDATARNVAAQSAFWAPFWASLYDVLPVNALPPPRSTQGGVQSQFISTTAYRLDADEALVVAIPPSGARYQGLELTDVWGQTLPYATRQSSLNAGQAQPASDGVVHLVIAHRDPGVPDWIDTVSSPMGLVITRWQGASGPPPPPSTRLVPVRDVRRVLPADTPEVDAAQRADQLRRRTDAARHLALASPDEQSRRALVAALARLGAVVGAGALEALLPVPPATGAAPR